MYLVKKRIVVTLEKGSTPKEKKNFEGERRCPTIEGRAKDLLEKKEMILL